ncbi:GDSL esterase/lipase At1g29670-like [Salvia miltiorrhiza]|uniref:GDSL esterase/lipase At1g29670-like n=1 Tax=Salvia miltiorrhiza TaxID=226208 RepID=UPI0025ABEEEC|nr:GDSL esterase/lipase At1g29670-like [Salvia miltiorrhiza]
MASAKNKYSKFYLCFLLQNLVCFQILIVAEPQFSCFFIFGDSFVDNGNNNYLQTTLRVNYLPYGIDFPTGPTGRFSNGRNIADFIAKMLGFKNSIPPFANGTTRFILRGLNYGSGGGGILNETGTQFGNLLSLSEQLSNHEITISRIQKLLGGSKKHLNECLYYVGIGTNDYILNYFPQFYSSTTIYTPQQFAALLITQYSKQLRRLYKDGARKVAVSEVGELGCMPVVIGAYGSPNSSSCVETSNAIVQIFNQHLKILIDNLNRDYPKAKFVYTRFIALSASTGNIKIVSEPCCVVGTGLCIEGSAPCSDRDDYRFWDEIHPTEAAAAVAGATAYDDISPLVAFVDN